MKLKIAAIFIIFSTQPAIPCHHYSRWYYPFPQRCYSSYKFGLIVSHKIYLPQPSPLPKPIKIFIPSLDQSTDTPRDDEDLQRHIGIEQLKELMKGK